MFHNPLEDLRHFSPAMTIAQVLKFFQRKQLAITRPMIQNYIRDGLVPPPMDGRIYTHQHIATLALVAELKTVFDMPTIKEALQPHMGPQGISLEDYLHIKTQLSHMLAAWQHAATPTLATEKDQGILLTMAFAAGLKATIMS